MLGSLCQWVYAGGAVTCPGIEINSTISLEEFSMMSGERHLRPMGLGDLLDEAISLYRQNFALFVGIVAVLTVPETILNILLNIGRSGNTVNGSYFVSTGGSTFIGLIFGILILGALSFAISQRYLDRPVTIGQAYSAVGMATFISLLVASILAGIAIVIGLALLLLPGIFLAVRWSMIAPSIVLERTGIGGGFSRSMKLTEGSFWRLLGIGLVVVLLIGVLEAIVAGVIAAILSVLGGGTVIAPLASGVVSILVQPLQLGMLVLVYYDLRVRREGFDLEMMATHMDAYSRV